VTNTTNGLFAPWERIRELPPSLDPDSFFFAISLLFLNGEDDFLLLFRLTKCKEDFQVDGFFVCTGFLWESINGDK
jgi:hypothetical protein